MATAFKCRCGNEPKVFKPGEKDEKQFVVQCVFCPHGPMVTGETEEKAIESWNEAMKRFGITE